MKKISTLLAMLLMGGVLMAQDYSVTFRVNMNEVDSVSANGVHMAGNFQAAAGLGGDWSPPDAPLSDDDGDGIYELTVTLPAGDYLFKFINDNNWGNNEGTDATELTDACSIDDGAGNINRTVTVSADTVLPSYKYDSCEPSDATSIRKSLNLAFTVAPNPFSSSAVVTFDNTAREAYNVTLVSTAGQVVRNYENVRSSELTIERGNLPTGLYLATFTNEAGERATTRLMIN